MQGNGKPAGRPLIGVTTSEVRLGSSVASISESDPPRREMVLGLRYLEAIEAAGGVPMVIPPLRPDAVEALVQGLAGVCLSGGPDIDPAAYGADPHPRLGPTEPELDAFELQLLSAAERRGLPVLAICRGAQMMNVARGGTLHQHLPDQVGEAIHHRQAEPAELPTHPVELSEGSLLARVVGSGRLDVNSFHHQSVSALGDGLAATAWAPDGTIEAFEGAEDRFLLGVQWHVEGLTALARHAAVFDAFVHASASFAQLSRVRAVLARVQEPA